MSLIEKIGCAGSVATILGVMIQISFLMLNDDTEMLPSEKLVIDSHKTKIVIDRIELKSFYKVNEPYVVMVIKNISDVTARNVSVSFVSDSGEIFAQQDGVRELWRHKNLAIESQKEAYIPVAPLSEYTEEISEKNRNAKLLKFRLPDVAEAPFEINSQVCGNDQDIIGCSYETIQRSTVVNISYESIFNEKISQLEQWFNIFLLGEPQISRGSG